MTLVFSQKLNPDFTTIVLSDAAQRIPASTPAVDDATGTINFGQALGNGVYTVAGGLPTSVLTGLVGAGLLLAALTAYSVVSGRRRAGRITAQER